MIFRHSGVIPELLHFYLKQNQFGLVQQRSQFDKIVCVLNNRLFLSCKVVIMNSNDRGEPETRMEPQQINSNNKNHVILKFVLAFLVIVLLSIIVYQTGLFHFFLSKKRLIHFLNSLGPWSFAGFIFLQIFQVVVAPVPGDVTGLLGGILFDPWMGVLLSTIGLTVGSYIAFALSRAFGRPFAKRFVPAKAMERFNFLLHHKGAFVVFLLFLLPGFPKDYLCYILGLGELSTLEFLVIGGTGRLFGTILLTFGGAYIKMHQYFRLSVVCGVGLLSIVLVIAFRTKLERTLRYWSIKSKRKRSKITDNHTFSENLS